jgi:hypothetical protein
MEYKIQSAEFGLRRVKQVHADAVTGKRIDKKIVKEERNLPQIITDRLDQKISIKLNDLANYDRIPRGLPRG